MSNNDLTKLPGTISRPRSAVSGWTGIVGLAGLAAALFFLAGSSLSPIWKTFICLCATALPMLVWDILIEQVHRNPSTGLDFTRPAPSRPDRARLSIKILGLWGTWALIAAAYWLFKTYDQPAYGWYLALLKALLPFLILLSVPYFAFIDRRMTDPRDGYWHAGLLFLGRWDEIDRRKLIDHFLTWIIKAFFLAFMCSILPNNVIHIVDRAIWRETFSVVAMTNWLIVLLFTVDICFGTVGYILTFRLTDSHVRSPNPLWSGWVMALICYPPFSLMGTHGPLRYADGHDWTFWFAGHPVLMTIWATILVGLTAIYALATVAFGIRFSNLTHRGILTNGLYGLTKHPAYLSKNAYWWFLNLTFLSAAGWETALRNSLLLVAVNLVYYARAKTEEAHLMSDPDYRAYADWIEQNGLMARIMRIRGQDNRV